MQRFVIGLCQGQGAVTAVERLSTAPPRLAIVAETAGRCDIWRVVFHDALAARIDPNDRTSEFFASCNEAWVGYDL